MAADDLIAPDRQVLTFGDDERELGERSLNERWELRTICNVIRRIHLTANNPEVSLLCAEAIYMAKAMSKRLEVYKHHWDKGLWVRDESPL